MPASRTKQTNFWYNPFFWILVLTIVVLIVNVTSDEFNLLLETFGFILTLITIIFLIFKSEVVLASMGQINSMGMINLLALTIYGSVIGFVIYFINFTLFLIFDIIFSLFFISKIDKNLGILVKQIPKE